MKQTLTGYPSIDKPWLQYYSEEAKSAKVPACTIYEYLYEKNKEHLGDTAMVYMGRKITYRELFHNIDRLSVAFSEEGIKDADIVTIIAPSLPEIIYSFYALNKIGAVSNFIDPRKSPEEVDAALSVMQTKACIVLDSMWEYFFDVAVKYTSKLISVSITDSLPMPARCLLGLKGKKKLDSKILPLNNLLKKYSKTDKTVIVPYVANKLALLEYTGGTTGISKGVMLSNENVNSVVEQTIYSGVPLKRGESWLAVAFPFIAYALICSQHMPLSLGITAYLCYSLDIKNVEKQLLKNKCNHMANTPLMWEQLIKSKHVAKKDLSFIIAPTVGADSLDVSKEKTINQFLQEHNCSFRLSKGYGMTEVSSGIAITPNNSVNKLGSVGISFPMTNIGIFEVGTDKELTYGEQGEICVQGPSVMLGYYNSDEANAGIFHKHEDGQVWLHSGDLGHIDEDGFLFIDGRIKRMIIDCTGFKIFASLVENVILDISEVEKCCVVGIKDTEHNVGQIPIAFVIAKRGTNKEQLRERIVEICEMQLPEYSYPRKIIFREEFPYTSAGKVDYKALEHEAE